MGISTSSTRCWPWAGVLQRWPVPWRLMAAPIVFLEPSMMMGPLDSRTGGRAVKVHASPVGAPWPYRCRGLENCWRLRVGNDLKLFRIMLLIIAMLGLAPAGVFLRQDGPGEGVSMSTMNAPLNIRPAAGHRPPGCAGWWSSPAIACAAGLVLSWQSIRCT